MKLNREAADATYRASFAAFVYGAWRAFYPGNAIDPNWHIDAICWSTQELFLPRRKPHLIINLPPRTLKSFIASVCLPAWLQGLDPTLSIIEASYADDLARKFSRDCRTLMESAFYKRIFPRTRLNPRKTSEAEFETTRRGSRLATSVGGVLTGRGCDLLIVDDPLKAQDTYSELARKSCIDWFNATAMSRLNKPGTSKVIVVMQRLHADDLAGYLIERGWKSLVMPAIATESRRYATGPGASYRRKAGELLHRKRDSREEFDNLRANHGSAFFSAQYQQNPVPPDGNMIKAEWLKFYRPSALSTPFDRVILTCDPAGKAGVQNDYTAIAVVGVRGRELHFLDVVRGHWNVLQMRDRILALAALHRVDEAIIEDTASGMGLIQILQGQSRVSVLGMHPTENKVTRLLRHQAKFECGQVWLPEGAPWSAELVHELLAFPNGKYDDQVDAMLLLFEWFDENRDYMADTTGIVIPRLVRGPDIWDKGHVR